MVIELPAGLLMRVIHPRYVIGVPAILFGVFACAMVAAKSYAAVMVLRVLIGLGEAFLNNAYLYISLWYRPEELSLRTGELIFPLCCISCYWCRSFASLTRHASNHSCHLWNDPNRRRDEWPDCVWTAKER